MEVIRNNGQFKKGNPGGPGRPKGSKNKRTLANEAIDTLNQIGINPIKTSTKLINELVQSTELSDKDKIQLLQTLTPLWKYQLLSQTEAHKIDDMQKEILELEEQNSQLKHSFTGTPQQLLQQLKREDTEDEINQL